MEIAAAIQDVYAIAADLEQAPELAGLAAVGDDPFEPLTRPGAPCTSRRSPTRRSRRSARSCASPMTRTPRWTVAGEGRRESRCRAGGPSTTSVAAGPARPTGSRLPGRLLGMLVRGPAADRVRKALVTTRPRGCACAPSRARRECCDASPATTVGSPGDTASVRFSREPGRARDRPSSSGSSVSRIQVQALAQRRRRRPRGPGRRPGCASRRGRRRGRRAARRRRGALGPARARAAGPCSGCRRCWPARLGSVAEAADVLPALGADRALRLVGRVEGELGEDLVVDLVDLAAHERQQRAALQPGRGSMPARSQIVG